MQTFSSMQRNSINSKDIIKHSLWLLLLVVYEAISTIYYLLPPLFGFFVAFLVTKSESRFVPFIFVYLLFFEADHEYFIASSWVFLLLFFRFFVPVIKDNIICKNCITVASVVASYVGYYLFLNFVYFILGSELLDFNLLLFLYFIVIESILAVFLL